MNKVTIITKALNKAHENGFTKFKFTEIINVDTNDSVSFKLEYGEIIMYFYHHINEIIFDHGFAMTFWKDSLGKCTECKGSGYSYRGTNSDGFYENIECRYCFLGIVGEHWTQHLNTLVGSIDRFAYVNKFL